MTADPYAILALAEAAAAASASASGSDERPRAALASVADEINPAVETLVELDRPAALRLVGALSSHWQNAGQVEIGRELTERALQGASGAAASDQQFVAAVPRALLTASELAFRQGDQEAARRRAHDAIRAAVLIEDYVTASLAESNLARVAYRDGDAPRIEKHARKALEYATDDVAARRGALHMLAWAAHTAGDMSEAKRRFSESLEFRRKTSGPLSVASELANIGDIAAEEGDLAGAARILGDVMKTSHELGSKYMLVNMFPSLASLASRAGLDEDAAVLFGAADAAAFEAGFIADPNPPADAERAALRDRLGEGHFAELLAAGTSLGNDAAVARALDVATQVAAAR